MSSRENADYLMQIAINSGINDSKELSNFMGQMQVESGGYTSMNENLNYSAQRLLEVFPGRNGLNTIEQANAIVADGQEVVADAIYGGSWGKNPRHLGNTEPGDGWKYHGRGYVQLTGRANYERVGTEMGLDLANQPELAGDREIAAKIAVHYWKSRVVPHGHQYDVTGACHDINGGEKGLQDRIAAAASWETKLARGYVPGDSEPEKALKPGAHGEGVSALQTNLAALGYTDNRGRALQPDGHYGPNTEAAVRAFQSDNGLLSDGIVGKHTLEAIYGQRQRFNPIPALAPELVGNPHARIDGLDSANYSPAPSKASAQPSNPFADPRHPDHGLYAELKARIPDASENRLVQMTAACHMSGIKPGRLGDIHIGTHGIVIAPDGGPGLPAKVDNSLSAPSLQETVQQVQTYDHQQVMQRQLDAQMEMTQQQSGPTLGHAGHVHR